MRLAGPLFFARAELRLALRQRETLIWTFVMPIVFFYFIGTVTGGFAGGGGSGRKDAILVEEGEDAGFLAGEIARRLEQNDYEVLLPDPAAEAEAERRLSIPARFTEDVLAGERRDVVLLAEGGGLRGDFDRFRVGRAVYTLVADLAAARAAGEEPTPEAFARLAAMPRSLALDVRPAGRRLKIPTGFEQTIPGTMVMFTLIVLLTSGVVHLVLQRREGLLRRLASTPITRGEVTAGKWAGLYALGLVQIAFAMLAGTLLFKMDWGPDLWMVCAVLLAWGALVASLAMLLGSFARSEGQAVAIGVISANVLAALGGCWWPIEITPEWMQTLALFLPTGWAMDAMHKLVSFQLGAASALPNVLGLLAAALLTGWAAARVFRFQ